MSTVAWPIDPRLRGTHAFGLSLIGISLAVGPLILAAWAKAHDGIWPNDGIWSISRRDPEWNLGDLAKSNHSSELRAAIQVTNQR